MENSINATGVPKDRQNAMRKQCAKIIISPGGGHGTCAIYSELNPIIIRPDQSFQGKRGTQQQILCGIENLPRAGASAEWARRTGTALRPKESIEANLLRLVQAYNGWIAFSGACSSVQPFLSKNGLSGFLLVREPLAAYTSLFSRQHPELGRIFGSHDSIAAVLFWAQFWNNVIGDAISAGFRVIRYEHLTEDAPHEIRTAVAKEWKPRKRDALKSLSPSVALALIQATEKNTATLYGDKA